MISNTTYVVSNYSLLVKKYTISMNQCMKFSPMVFQWNLQIMFVCFSCQLMDIIRIVPVTTKFIPRQQVSLLESDSMYAVAPWVAALCNVLTCNAVL